MKKPLSHFWNESTRHFIKCDIYACTYKHTHKKLEFPLSGFQGKCKPTLWSHHLPKGCTICYCQSKELLTTPWVLPHLSVHGMQVACSSWLDALFITSKAVTMPSSALSQRKKPIPIPFLENSGRPLAWGILLLVWRTLIVSYSRGYGMFED